MKMAVIVGGFPKLSETFILRQLTGLVDLATYRKAIEGGR